jgi:hypothetical protein
VAAYAAGTSTGAGVTALLAWVLGGVFEPLPAAARAAVLVLGAVTIWLAKDGPLSRWIHLPEARRQIPAEVLSGSMVRAAYRFGFELGTGVRTYVTSAAPYVLLLVVLLARLSLEETVLIGLGYGLGRALPLVGLLLGVERSTAGLDMCARVERSPVAWAWWLVLAGGLSLV